MRHRHGQRKLNRTSSHREAMLRNMCNSLLRHEVIKTTLPKAKELRRVVEPLTTLGQKPSLATRRRARRHDPRRRVVERRGEEVRRAGGRAQDDEVGRGLGRHEQLVAARLKSGAALLTVGGGAHGSVATPPRPINVVAHVRRLEEVMIRACADLGVATTRVEGRSGVWVLADEHGPDRKLGAIGVRVSRTVTTHGFALNACCDPVSYTHLRAHETVLAIVCRLLLDKKKHS